MNPRTWQLHQLTVNNLTQTVVLLIVLLVLGRLVQVIRRNFLLAVLRGPPRTNLFWGRLLEVMTSKDVGLLFEEWANNYGPVFRVPGWFGSSQVIICDPKAFAHFQAADNAKYERPPFINKYQRAVVGESMANATPEDHQRIRRILTPAFSIAAIRELKGVFYESTYRVKGQWDLLFESNHEIVVDVQQWMHKLSLDSIGIAGFGHDFRAGNGHQSVVTETYDAIYKLEDPRAYHYFYVLGLQFPQIVNLPLKSAKIYGRMKEALREIAFQMFDNAGKSTPLSDTVKDRSIIGLLLKDQVENAKSGKLSLEEVIGQIVRTFHNVIKAAIHDSPLTSVFSWSRDMKRQQLPFRLAKWGLIELARHPHVQEKLREELRQFSNDDPTWDQLMSGLPYLDAFTREVLRLHPTVDQIVRVATQDDVVPLSAPMQGASGQILEQIHIPKGTVVIAPIKYINCCEVTWGSDSRNFVPERWLEEHTNDSKEGGTKRLWSFSDGPRFCIGKVFALAELKTAFNVLVRNYSFELLDGPGTKIDIFKPRLPPRPKVAGEVGSAVPMRVKQVT